MTCPTCNGTGVVYEQHEFAIAFRTAGAISEPRRCPHCKGTGKTEACTRLAVAAAGID